MRFGLICDGTAERYAWAGLADRLPSSHQFTGPVLYADVQSTASAAVEAKAVLPRVTQLRHKGVDLVVLVIDLDASTECPGARAQSVRSAILRHPHCPSAQNLEVVVKNQMLENWLIADLSALRSMPKRFRVSGGDASRVEPDKADNIDARAAIERMAVGGYQKAADMARIMTLLDPTTAASNSRSFRRLLRVLGDAAFSAQSRRPMARV